MRKPARRAQQPKAGEQALKPIRHIGMRQYRGIGLSCLLLLLFAALSSPAPALAATKAERLAKQLGHDIGAAQYCGLDADRLQVLRTSYNGKMMSASENTADLIDAQKIYIENERNAARRAPREGCESIISRLQSPTDRGINNLGQRMETLENLTVQQLEMLKEQQEAMQDKK
jgi:hypothetical protein